MRRKTPATTSRDYNRGMNAPPLSLAVVGSINLDMVARVKAFPRDGETISDAVLDRHPGGKGGNQALAARRLNQLQEAGVNLDKVTRLEGENTGVAMILVDERGENQIVVAPGANAKFHERYLDEGILLESNALTNLSLPIRRSRI